MQVPEFTNIIQVHTSVLKDLNILKEIIKTIKRMNFSFRINVIAQKLFTFFTTLTYIGIPIIFYYTRSHNSGFVNWYKWMIPTYILTIVLCTIIKWIRQIISRFIRDRIIYQFNDFCKSIYYTEFLVP